jgi:DNA-binding GntR family transcriptional regulator
VRSAVLHDRKGQGAAVFEAIAADDAPAAEAALETHLTRVAAT